MDAKYLNKKNNKPISSSDPLRAFYRARYSMTSSILTPFFGISMCHPSSPLGRIEGMKEHRNIHDMSGCHVCFYLSHVGQHYSRTDQGVRFPRSKQLPPLKLMAHCMFSGLASGQGLVWYDSPRGGEPDPHSKMLWVWVVMKDGHKPLNDFLVFLALLFMTSLIVVSKDQDAQERGVELG